MTIDEYIERVNTELVLLKELFIKENLIDPKNWPLEMDEGDWREQHIDFINSIK
jgi:hypothetical protein